MTLLLTYCAIGFHLFVVAVGGGSAPRHSVVVGLCVQAGAVRLIVPGVALLIVVGRYPRVGVLSSIVSARLMLVLDGLGLGLVVILLLLVGTAAVALSVLVALASASVQAVDIRRWSRWWWFRHDIS